MKRDTNVKRLTLPSFSLCVAAGARGFIAALAVFAAAPIQAQTAGSVLRPWNCLTNSVSAARAFGVPVTQPGCTVPAVIWPGPAPASAIIPPGTPGGLAAAVTGRTVVLTWTPPITGGTPTSYLLQAGSASGLTDLVNTTTESAFPTLTATNVPGGTYFFRVLAQSAAGTSAASNEIAVSVGAGVRASVTVRAEACTVPPPPTALTRIQDGNISVTFVWGAGEGPCQAFALPDYYTLEYGAAPGAAAGSFRLPAHPTTATFSLVGVGSGTYYVRIKAVNKNGSSPASNEVVLRVGGVCNRAPLAPTNLSFTVSGSTIVLTWDDSSPAADTPTAYRATAGLKPGDTVSSFGVSGNIFRLTAPAGSYYFRIAGINACGVSPVSGEVFVTVGGPAVPVVVTGVHQFKGAPTDGSNWSTLMQARDGNFYGTSVTGGAINPRCVSNLEGCGTIYKMTPGGAVTLLHNFGQNGSSPIYPYSRLLQTSDGNFWGTTTGQENGNGAASLYKMTPDGSVTFLTELGGPSFGALIQGTDGNIYGTTVANGAGTCSWRSTQCLPSAGSGAIFRVNSSGGALTYPHVFNGTDGSKPYAGLVQATDGNFYGSTQTGGAHNAGTIFKMTPGGALTTLHTFTGGADGANPYASLMQASDGNLFGTTQFGGGPADAGTVFKITTAGAHSVLHAFTGVVTPNGAPPPTTAGDGVQPGAGLFEASDGKLYGVAGGGGGYGGGTAFSVTKDGAYTQLYSFDGSNAGGSPTATLFQATDGNLYGTTQYGGTYNRGVIFKMTLPR